MGNKHAQDATSSISGTIYQFYIALDYCFDLSPNETLYIEKYGDITISCLKQVEIKKYSDDLTDLHENIWNTLKNWLREDFDISFYKNLILVTTQEFGRNSSFIKWNGMTAAEKENTLNEILITYNKKKKRDKDKVILVESVMTSDNKNKRLAILEKFEILDSSLKENAYFENIKSKKLSHIPLENRDNYINSLLGFIICPEILTVNSWKITYEMFSAKLQSLTEQYCAHTKIFPRINIQPTTEQIQATEQHLFVKKIDAINYSEAKSEAILHYLETNRIILDELSKYSVPKDVYDNYEKELFDFYLPTFRKAKRVAAKANDPTRESQDFYDNIMSSPIQPFYNFNNTTTSFRNGMYQNMADDEKQKITWKLYTGDSNE